MRLAAWALFGLVLVAGAVWVFALWNTVPALPGFTMSVEGFEEQIRSWGPWGVAGSILLMILHNFIPFPAEILAMANGMVYGPLWGTVITWTGAMLGAYLAFGLARWLGQPFVLAMVGERHRVVVERWTAEQGGPTLLFSRLVPVISFNLINYAAGLTTISWWTFTWATALGIVPLTFLMVLMGDRIWSGDNNVWLWFVAAAVAGWFLWWLMTQKGRRRGEVAGGPLGE